MLNNIRYQSSKSTYLVHLSSASFYNLACALDIHIFMQWWIQGEIHMVQRNPPFGLDLVLRSIDMIGWMEPPLSHNLAKGLRILLLYLTLACLSRNFGQKPNG